YKVADELAAAGVGASTFSDWWAYKVEAYDAIPYNAALMTKRGVVVSINSDDAEEATHLNQEAAKSMKFGGLTHDEALKLVTINPAVQLGIDKRVGSIEVGKDADLVIYNHDPLSAYAVVQKTLVDGRVLFDRDKDIAGRTALENEKKELLAKEKAASKKSEEKSQRPDERKPEEKPKPPYEEQSAVSATGRCKRELRSCAKQLWASQLTVWSVFRRPHKRRKRPPLTPSLMQKSSPLQVPRSTPVRSSLRTARSPQLEQA